jgi:tetratricopeptide (TPR) repeat protein
MTNISSCQVSAMRAIVFSIRQVLNKPLPVVSMQCWPLLLALVLLTGCDRRPASNPASGRRIESPPAVLSAQTEATDVRQPLARGAAPRAKFVPDAACRDCHEALYESYQDVGMSQSFSRFDEATAIESFDTDGDKNHFFHEASRRHYELSVADGVMFVTRYRLRQDGTRFARRHQRVDYVIGSGNHVRGYFYRNHVGEMFELPVVWYAQESRWGMAPGYNHAEHEGFDRPVTRQCMFCHNAYPALERGADAFGSVHLFPEHLPHGIGCQRCHGPGSEHVRLASESALDEAVVASIVNPAHLSTELAEDVCLQCHLQPMSRRTSIVQRFGHPDYAFRPGEPLHEYLVHLELDEDTAKTDRFDINHHPYRLRQSACYQGSGGELSCTKCHDPHAKVAVADRVSYYRERCFSCHGASACLDQPRGRAPDADCVSCHMPTRRTEDVVHVTMTDHKITRPSGLNNPTAVLAEASLSLDLPTRPYDRARPWLNDASLNDASLNDAALQIYGRVAAARDGSPAAAVALQANLRQQHPATIEPWLQLGQSQVEAGMVTEAVVTLRDVLVRDPENALAHVNLGTALIVLRDYEQAAQHLRSATSLTPTRAEAWFNLGLALAKLDQSDAARAAYHRALQLRPTYAKCRFNLGNLLAREGKFHEARQHFERAIALDPDYTDAYRNLSAAHRAQGAWKEAIVALEDGLISLPQDPMILRDAAIAYLGADDRALRDTKRALVLSEDFVKYAPAKPQPALLLALALVANGQAQEGFQQAKRATKIGADERDGGLVMMMAIWQMDADRREAVKKLTVQVLAGLADQPTGKIRGLIKQLTQERFGETTERPENTELEKGTSAHQSSKRSPPPIPWPA